ncbi:hypothetical protein BDV39DRAFT_191017 [Aspergillus sergii]|uniref:glucose oxidase n=1 Tax=Aspergillus sergii TaxID=1034303 RepID=A0A5N6X900_9EURO|nr:hypothetical protein BDV39DRAFT_191017 [Aspergillus sergii]
MRYIGCFLLPLAMVSAYLVSQVDVQASLLINPRDVTENTFDYIIAGGGLTGLTVAAKLTENPNIEVLVIEKGFYKSNNGPIIEDPNTYGQTLSGKGLGGPTLINGNSWTCPDKNWDNVIKYINQTEHAHIPTTAQIAAGHHFNPACHSFNGTVHTGPRDNSQPWSPLITALINTTSALGVLTQVDFHCSHSSRNQVIRKVLFDNNAAGYKAIRVNFGQNKAINFNIYAKYKVLLAIGSAVSPLILEYSGIGLKSMLNKADICQRLEIPADGTVARGGFHNITALIDITFVEPFLNTAGHIKFDLWNLILFTRGLPYILSSDLYLWQFTNDPKFFFNKLDLLGSAAVMPGIKLPYKAILGQYAEYIRDNFRANWHAVGSCSIIYRELGDVVDATAKVYDTQGLRVIDGSIPPTQVSSNVMTIFDGMALRIADLILDDYARTH